MGMIRAWCVSILLLGVVGWSASSSARQKQVRVDRIEVLQSGLYEAEGVVETKPEPASPDGERRILSGIKFVTRGPQIEARVGVHFGVQYRVAGAPDKAPINVKVVWKIPAPGITNPNNKNTYREASNERPAKIGVTALTGYEFDNAWEVVPGVWTVEIWYGDRKLAEQSFAVK